MQHYRLSNNALDFPNQSAPDWERVHGALARPTMTPAEAMQCAPGTTVKVRGVVRAGDRGPLTAPISGEHCAWYRSYVQPGTWLLQPLPAAGRFADTMLVANPAPNIWVRRYDPTDEISESPFAVAGADGSALWVDPRIADVNSDRVARNRVETTRLGLTSQLLVEFVLPIGAEVMLLGVMGAGGELVTDKDAFVFVSTRSEARLLDRSAHATVGGRGLNLGVMRFVRGGNRVKRVLMNVTRTVQIITALIILALVIFVVVH